MLVVTAGQRQEKMKVSREEDEGEEASGDARSPERLGATQSGCVEVNVPCQAIAHHAAPIIPDLEVNITIKQKM